MRRWVLAAAFLAVLPVFAPGQFAAAAERTCFSPADLEAEQAILFQTNLMVVSSTCHDAVYAEFRLRNRREIIHYQNAMIAHFRRAGSRRPDRAFETWITHLANEASNRQLAVSTAQLCRQSVALEQLAASLDPRGFRRYAVAQAAANVDHRRRCAR
jgi:hypothetical protein